MAETIDIGIATQNANSPEQPEHGKGQKRRSHAGCCGNCGEENCYQTVAVASKTIIRQRNVRTDFV